MSRSSSFASGSGTSSNRNSDGDRGRSGPERRATCTSSAVRPAPRDGGWGRPSR
jgi:hypothetical protein